MLVVIGIVVVGISQAPQRWAGATQSLMGKAGDVLGGLGVFVTSVLG
jgi:hypothetical protein